MRKLFTYPLLPLTSLLRALLAISLFTVALKYDTRGLPLPLGRLSDYGNVLDRHGRERINELIEQTYQRYQIEAYILASWENPYNDIHRYTIALLDAWHLANSKAFLAVFLKVESRWMAEVVAGSRLTKEHPQLADRLESGISNLVEHARIEEAMAALFDVLEQQLAKGVSSSDTLPHGIATRLLLILLVIGCTVALGVFITRRICPRCGRILKTRRAGVTDPHGRHIVVYYCRRCGYSRTK